MSDAYKDIPTAEEMRRAEQHIRRTGTAALVAFFLVAVAAFHVLPRISTLPDTLVERMAFAIVASLPALLCLATAIMLVSTRRRHSPEDIGGSAAREPSPYIAVQAAFLQNTLEQTVLAIGAYLVFAVLLSDAWLSLLPVSASFFVIGRILFYRGYRQGASGRALGMTLTMVPTIVLFLASIAVLAGNLLNVMAE